ncbi:group II intron reverse transcriptase/maturase [Paraburkholderia caribensis]|uniref:group II intron reverse transcriptase/maturase n=1 Tax=Paraburkholderia caribensis TaxID=75105 RepID=UPI003F490582
MGAQQKTHRVLDSGGRGEALRAADRGAEPMAANPESESPSACDRLMEEVCERENLKQALKRVKANKGAPGVDGMTVQALPAYLREHWASIRSTLLNGTYKPQPVRRVEIPKPDGGGVRKLGIPSALDRFVQQAVLQVLQRQWDPTFSDSSYGFRPGRSAHQAVGRAQGYIQAGYRWVVDLDLEKFFDRVSHDILMSRVAKRVGDRRVLKLIRSFLTAGVLENGLVGATDEGTPQGGPLSPLLSNLMLDDLDRELERRGLRFARYADDCNVYVRSERAGQRVMAGLKAFLTGKLKLKVNEAKSAVAWPHTRKFLGFTFSNQAQVKRRIAPKALARFKDRIRELTQRTRGVSVDQMIGTLKRYLTGWRGYFGYCETPGVLRKLDEWIRRRIRCFFWKQWKHSPARFQELTARGVSRNLAAQTVGSPHGVWRLSCSPALSIALSNRYFRSLGLPSVGS